MCFGQSGIVWGCTEVDACNYSEDATDDNCTCTYSCYGCTDADACNFDEQASIDDNSCLVPSSFYHCEGLCLNDLDLDGVCDELEVLGCMDAMALNFNAAATEHTSQDCIFDEPVLGCTDDGACNFNASAQVDNLSCEYECWLAGETGIGCDETLALNNVDLGLNWGQSIVDISGHLQFINFDLNYYLDGLSGQPLEAFQQEHLLQEHNFFIRAPNGNCLQILTDPQDMSNVPESFGYHGFCAVENTFSVVWSGGDGCCSPEEDMASFNWGNYVQTYDVGEFNLSGSGMWHVGFGEEVGVLGVGSSIVLEGICGICKNPTACNYGSEGTCEFETCAGCTVAAACNYDSLATIDDGTCAASCAGCTDPVACNYWEFAVVDDETCVYPVPGLDCEGGCLDDADGDGVCDPFEFFGCTDTQACNYNAFATEQSPGDCDYASCAGCTCTQACNFDAQAVLDNGECVYLNSECDSCQMGSNGEPEVVPGDVNEDGICDVFQSFGCAYEFACNFDETAEILLPELCLFFDECGICDGDNSTCTDECGVVNGPGAIYECGCTEVAEGECDCEGSQPVEFYDCDGVCVNDQDQDGVCDELEVMGCTSPTACNYLSEATDDDGSCIEVGVECDDGNSSTVLDEIGMDCECQGFSCHDPEACNYTGEGASMVSICDYESCLGCVEEGACNFNALSTTDDGSCFFVGDTCNDGNPSTANDVVEANCDCAGEPIEGCLSLEACNYSDFAMVDDGSCVFVGDPCDDFNPLTFVDVVSEDCFCGGYEVTEVEGVAFQLVLHPNPASGRVCATNESGLVAQALTWRLFDSSGQLVLEHAEHSGHCLDVSRLATGVYMLQIWSSGAAFTSRLLIDD